MNIQFYGSAESPHPTPQSTPNNLLLKGQNKLKEEHDPSRKRSNTYNVLEARLVSSCLSCPSSARPHLSLLLANSGVSVNTLDSVNPGAT